MTIHVPLQGEQVMRLSEETGRMLGDYVVRLIQQGIAERDQNLVRWKQCRDDLANEPIAYLSNRVKGWVDVPQPFAQPRENALSDFVVTSVTTQSPMATCMLAGRPEKQEDRERTMDLFLRRGQLGERLKTIAPSAWCTNHGLLRLSYGGPENPLNIESVVTEDFIVVGAGAYNIRQSRLHGHRYQMARGELKMLQRASRYAKHLDMDELPSITKSRMNQTDSKASVTTQAAGPDDEMVELWQVYAFLDPKSFDEREDAQITGKERRFSIVIEPTKAIILRIEEYTYRNPCYFSFGYKAAPEKGFWAPRSVGSDMQGPHRAYNCLGNLALLGGAMAVGPPLVASGGSFTKDQEYGPFEFVDMDAGTLSVPAVSVDLQKVQAELARIERMGDSVARINSAGIAQESMQSKTATQSNNEAAGMKAGIGGYLETFVSDFPELCEHAEEILADTFDEWKPVYGESAPVGSPEDLQTPARWDVPGKVPNLNPQMVLQNVQTLMGMVTQGFEIVAAHPFLSQFFLDLVQMAMNAMDFPNADELMKSLNPPVEEPYGNQAIGGPAGMVAGPDPLAGMGPVPQGMGDPQALEAIAALIGAGPAQAA